MNLSGYVLETLREGREFDLFRGRSPDNAVPILLVACPAQQTSASMKRLEHEYALADELDPAWALRPLALTRHRERPMLVLGDPGGGPLDRLVGRPLALPRFLHIAIGLAAALGKVHRRGLIHKDIKPANVFVDDACRVHLTGFGIASRLARERQPPITAEIITGTLAYMAPEQTGRMNRSIDARSDLYSLGVTLYEMATGAPPFAASDPMEWIHCHIARQPRPPGECVEGLPGVLEAIVLKLLAKNAEDRYQTAGGVEADLARCLKAWTEHGRIAAFPLGERDTSERLLIPEKLYGREDEIATLVAVFDRVATRGTVELVLVSGYSGIGKSSIVNELHKVLVPPRGLFAAGKFEQFKRDIPYATLAQAFTRLVRQLLSKNDEELSRWRQALLEALGRNGQLMVNLIPELVHVIGEQPPVADLPPQDTQSRFYLILHRFIGVFARPEHPLALFLDDLQWLDAATLGLIERLIVDPDLGHLMLIGAYRDNEVDPEHPLRRTLRMMGNPDGRVSSIVLAPLVLDDVVRLVADALRAPSADVRPLAELVHEKTGGNPFFAIQFVTAMAEEGLLAFDPDGRAWRWSMDRIRGKRMTDNVADLMATKLRRLPRSTQDVLGQMACLGNVAEIATMAMLRGSSEDAIHEALQPASQASLIFRVDGTYAFLHDRVQDAAYALIPKEVRASAHVGIGRMLIASIAPSQVEERVFEIVNQLDRGAALIQSFDERTRVAGLNLVAGKRAKTSTAYASALTYFAAGRALLGPDGWERNYRLAFDLELHHAECEFMAGEHAGAEARIIALRERAADLADLSDAVRLAVLLYFTTGRSDLAAEASLAFLRRVGIAWSSHPTDEEVEQEYRQMKRRLASRPVESLIDLPPMTDRVCRATMEVLTEFFPAAFYVDKNLLELVLLRMTNLSLEHGHNDGSTVAYAALNMVLGPRFSDYRTAVRLGELACSLVDQRGLDRFRARVYSCFGSFGMAWTKHLPACRPLLRRALDNGIAIGDMAFAAYTYRHLITNLLVSGEPLAEVQQEAEHALAFARKARLGVDAYRFIGQLALIRALRGLARDPADLEGAGVEDQAAVQREEVQPHLAMAAFFNWIFKLERSFFAQDRAAGIEAVEQATGLLWTARSCFEDAEYHFYGALARAAACDSRSAAERERHLKALVLHRRQIAIWAENCRENFANRAALVGAEIARLEGNDLQAMHLYEESISSARDYNFVQNEGLANELAAGFYASRGFQTIANAYLANARGCYLRWGADGKVRQLDRIHPHIRDHATPAVSTGTFRAPVEQLDVGTMLKASQALSGEIVLESLIETLMRLAVEHVGAERGLLVLLRNGETHIAAEARTTGGAIEVTLRESGVTPLDLPESALHYVVRTGTSLILDDASVGPPISEDEYVRHRSPRSILCIPIVKQTTVVGALYLENNLTPHAFTPERITVLEFLAAQAAISLENAYLYADLQRSEAFLAEGQSISGTGSWSWNIASGRLRWSQEHYRIFGKDPRGQPTPTFEWLMEMIHPDDRGPLQRQLEQVLRSPARFEVDFRIVLDDGATRYLHSVGRPIVEDTGQIRDYIGTSIDVTERKRMDRHLQASLEEKEALLKEVHHRVKNNLQLISSLLSLQASRIADPAVAEMFAESRNRVRSMALVHENLYRAGNFARVPMRGHIENLCAHLVRAYQPHAQGVDLATEIEDVHLDLDRAVSCGLILNELVSNALKHAFPDGRPGSMRVVLKHVDEQRCQLVVMDNGVGLPANLEAGHAEAFGLQLVHDLASQLYGEVVVNREGGTSFAVTFDMHDRGGASR